MKITSFFTVILTVSICFLSSCKPAIPETGKNWIWVHANDQKTAQEWAEDFAQYKKTGIDALLVGAKKDVLKKIIPLAQEADLEVHAWMWTLNRNGDTIAMKHPEWFSVNRLGESCFDKKPYVDYYNWVCPSIPEVQEHIIDQVKDLLTLEGLAGIHLDYVRYSDAILPKGLWSKYDIVQDKVYPQWDYGYNPSNITAFKDKFGYSPLDLEDPNTDSDWVEFRLNTVTELVNKIVDVVHQENKILSAAVFPSPEMSKQMVYQPWDQWHLDAVMPMIYHNFYEEDIEWIGEQTSIGIKALNGKFPIYAGLFVPDLKGNALQKAIVTANNAGANGCALFDARSFEKLHHSRLK